MQHYRFHITVSITAIYADYIRGVESCLHYHCHHPYKFQIDKSRNITNVAASSTGSINHKQKWIARSKVEEVCINKKICRWDLLDSEERYRKATPQWIITYVKCVCKVCTLRSIAYPECVLCECIWHCRQSSSTTGHCTLNLNNDCAHVSSEDRTDIFAATTCACTFNN